MLLIAQKYAIKALDLDENDYQALMVLGRTYLYSHDFEKAEHYFRKSIRMNPNDANNLMQIAFLMVYLGYADEALKLYNKANKLNPFQIKIRNQTVCFRDLIIRYLHTQIHQSRNFSNLICHDCSMILLDIEQCATYLRKTINHLKVKLNKSNRLRTSSLSATFQKKKQQQQTGTPKVKQLSIIDIDSDEEFDDIDDEEVCLIIIHSFVSFESKIILIILLIKLQNKILNLLA